jgi:hypothetical protein
VPANCISNGLCGGPSTRLSSRQSGLCRLSRFRYCLGGCFTFVGILGKQLVDLVHVEFLLAHRIASLL